MNVLGQLKSTVVCPHQPCNRKSITFDPFMYLSVPQPHINTTRVYITLVRTPVTPSALAAAVPAAAGDGEVKTANTPLLFGVDVDRDGSIVHLKKVSSMINAINALLVLHLHAGGVSDLVIYELNCVCSQALGALSGVPSKSLIVCEISRGLICRVWVRIRIVAHLIRFMRSSVLFSSCYIR